MVERSPEILASEEKDSFFFYPLLLLTCNVNTRLIQILSPSLPVNNVGMISILPFLPVKNER